MLLSIRALAWATFIGLKVSSFISLTVLEILLAAENYWYLNTCN